MYTYIALLRGINVGGNNIISMQDLRACLSANGFSDVKTYIQSGNVAFQSRLKTSTAVLTKLKQVLRESFDYKLPILVLTPTDVRATIDTAPKGFGQHSDRERYDVIFTIEPLTPKKALTDLEVRDGVDDVHAGKTAIYFTRQKAQITKSKLSTIAKKTMYKQTTIRNWNTTQKLLELVETYET